MQLGMIGLGRMGANMVRRLRAGVGEALVGEGAVGADSLATLVRRLTRPRSVWLMVPVATVDATIAELLPHLEADDIVIDGGNSHFPDDIRRARELGAKGIRYVDVGTSGGVWGRERGYCLMIGGPDDAIARLDRVFATLAPGSAGVAPIERKTERKDTAAHGYLHCGPSGAGHFVKMVHNGIEYGMMAAYAEGLSVLHAADVGKHANEHDAETTPLRDPELYRYDFDLAAIAEVWRRGSVISSWLLDLTATAFAQDPALAGFQGRVADSGEGRWTVQAAIDEGVPVPVLTAALAARFSSRGLADFQNKILSAMRFQFGGHVETPKK